jgi:hypothetical protein
MSKNLNPKYFQNIRTQILILLLNLHLQTKTIEKILREKALLLNLDSERITS